MEAIDEVLECIAIGRDLAADIEVILFVRLKAGVAFDAALEKRIKQAIRTGTSPRHVPDGSSRFPTFRKRAAASWWSLPCAMSSTDAK